jgi:hypothetical protein
VLQIVDRSCWEIDLRCMNIADTCICVGLKVYSIVMTLESAVNADPRTIDRKVNAGSPSSRTETMNLETSAPARVSQLLAAVQMNAYHFE